MHLLCEDNKLLHKSINAVKTKCKKVIITIKNYQFYKVTFKNHTEAQHITSSLKLPLKTRLGRFLFCLQCLKTNKELLQAFTVDNSIQCLNRDVKLTILDDDIF